MRLLRKAGLCWLTLPPRMALLGWSSGYGHPWIAAFTATTVLMTLWGTASLDWAGNDTSLEDV